MGNGLPQKLGWRKRHFHIQLSVLGVQLRPSNEEGDVGRTISEEGKKDLSFLKGSFNRQLAGLRSDRGELTGENEAGLT